MTNPEKCVLDVTSILNLIHGPVDPSYTDEINRSCQRGEDPDDIAKDISLDIEWGVCLTALIISIPGLSGKDKAMLKKEFKFGGGSNTGKLIAMVAELQKKYALANPDDLGAR